MALGTCLAGGCAPGRDVSAAQAGGAFNLRIVSDSVPDWSSRENFVRSALSKWPTDAEKAVAQFRWSWRCRRVGPVVHEDGRQVLDPVLFFNSYGMCFCGHISAINAALWEAWGKQGRLVDLPGHVVAEVFYDNAWHMFDNDFGNYFINEKGAVASAAELGGSRIHGNVEDLKPGEYYVFDHCPDASAPRGHIFQGPNSWWLIDVGRDWYPGPTAVKPRPDAVGCPAGHRYVLGLRPNETYTRYWRPLGTGTLYARPFPNGRDPAADGSPLKNSRSNGLWSWKPDLSIAASCHESENVEFTPDGLRVKDRQRQATAVFRVMAANVITSARMRALTRGPVAFSISATGGASWEKADTTSDEAGVAEGVWTDVVAGRLEYVVKVSLSRDAQLSALALDTTTQVNPRALPALRLGKNQVVAVSDDHLETLTFSPRLSKIEEGGEVHSAAGWQAIRKPRHAEPTIRGTGKADLVLRATALRDIRRVRMACTPLFTEPSAELVLALSFDGGKTWKRLGRYSPPGAPYDRRLVAETRDIPRGTRDLLMRYAFDAGGSGLFKVFAEVGHEPAGAFMPYDIVYCWSEWRESQWVERQHRERVTTDYHKYIVNVGGDRPPRMNWVRIEPAGAHKTGYSLGEDVGARDARPPYRLIYGKNVSVGCAYTVSREPSSAFPDKGQKLPGVPADRLLTDGFIGQSSVWKLDGINLTGEKNEKRVGELVVWGPGKDVVVTLDLGKAQQVGGARVAAIQPNPNVLFPPTMTVETSLDGRMFKPMGQASWEDCFFPPGDQLLWEGFDSPVYEDLPAGGMTCYRFPILFSEKVKARYVRFTLGMPADPKAGIGLYEVDVWDHTEKAPWNDRLVLPAGPGE